MLKSRVIHDLHKSQISDEAIRRLSAAVMLQAAKDYKADPDSRKRIEGWIMRGNMWQEIALPNLTVPDIIRGLRRYAEE